jgi:hypothetical protein
MTPSYPLHLEGSLDPPLSRWQPLVKWLLVIPHVIALAFLWIAYMVLSVAALVAIVPTGRYPRALFDFNCRRLREPGHPERRVRRRVLHARDHVRARP